VLTGTLRRRSFGVRYLALLTGEIGSKVCVVVAFGWLAHVLGPGDFGAIEFALSVTIFFVLAAECGLGSYGARLIEETPHRAPELIPQVGLIRATLALAGYLVMMAIAATAGTAGAALLGIYGLVVLLTPFNTQWVFQGLRQMQWVAIGSFLRYCLFAALVLIFVRPGVDARIVGLAEVGGALTLAAFNSALLGRVLEVQLQWRRVFQGAWELFKDAWFLGASDLTWAAMWYSPVIIAGWIHLTTPEQVGWLAAAIRIVMALHAFVWLYFFNMVPNLTREIGRSVDEWRTLIHRSLDVSMWVACLVALAGTVLAPFVMRTIFGQAFAPAALSLRIAIWMIPVAWLSGHFRFSLIAGGRQHLEFRAAAIAGITTMALVVPGAWLYGAAGASAALLVGGVVNAIAAGMASQRALGTVRLSTAAPAIGTCLASVVIWLALGRLIGEPAAAAIAGLFYAAMAAARCDVHQLKSAWGRTS
jgi:O-antigen/teichoic acid export membrane protein